MKERRTVIIGAGLAGLAAGRRLQEMGEDFVILEARSRPGGLCRTEEIDGFRFDYTGHLLHLRDGPARDWVTGPAGIDLVEHTRRASVFLDGRYVPYPIQAYFGQLSPELAHRCLAGLEAASDAVMPADPDFTTWARLQFGDGLAELFMLPYNRKLYRHPLQEMEVSWTSWSVPRPTLEEVRRAAAGKPPAFGYNATFYYPADGGIEILPRTLARGLENRLRTRCEVTAIDTAAGTVTTAGGDVFGYESLISTMPMPQLLTVTGGLPADLAEAAARLRYSSVLAVCLGFDHPAARDDHWIYVPGEDYPFYRVGIPSNFSDTVAPPGCASFYAEVSHLPGHPPDAGRLGHRVEAAVRDMGLISTAARRTALLNLSLPCAYVFYDRFRRQALDPILDHLRQRGIRTIGRYGAWEYSAMQDAIESGFATAAEVAG